MTNTVNGTLASLWLDDGVSTSRVVTSGGQVGTELHADLIDFYKKSGLEIFAKESGIIDANGELTGLSGTSTPTKAIQMVAVPISNTPARLHGSPMKVTPQILPKVITAQQLLAATQQTPRQAQLLPVNVGQWAQRKRHAEFLIDADFSDGKRSRKGEKGGKGLRHFSMKVCEKVQQKGVTTYNEVADELVGEFTDPRSGVSLSDQAYDQKNIRRRVYDALNVLMAMNIISKEKKEIRWIGLPTNSAQECQNLENEKQRRIDRIRHKKQQLQELILQQIAFKNVVQRNREKEISSQSIPAANSSIQLPFITVNTSKKTVIDCSISNDKYEYLFSFDNTFEIHDDIEVLKRMGMAYGLEKGQCDAHNLAKISKMVPDALKPYVIELANSNTAITGQSNVIRPPDSESLAEFRLKQEPGSPLAVPLAQIDATDTEVAMATGMLSRQSSSMSYSEHASHGTPATPSEFSDEEDDEDSDMDETIDIL